MMRHLFEFWQVRVCFKVGEERITQQKSPCLWVYLLFSLQAGACLDSVFGKKQMDAQNWCQSIYYVARNKLSRWLLSSAEQCWTYVLNVGWQEQSLFRGWEGNINQGRRGTVQGPWMEVRGQEEQKETAKEQKQVNGEWVKEEAYLQCLHWLSHRMLEPCTTNCMGSQQYGSQHHGFFSPQWMGNLISFLWTNGSISLHPGCDWRCTQTIKPTTIKSPFINPLGDFGCNPE